jgi:hypothetical protein
MNHEQIDQFDLIDRYVRGNLPAEESAAFEEHFVDCSECVARLQTTKNFLKDLRLVAAEQAVQNDSRPVGGAFRVVLMRPVAWAAACLLVGAVAGTLFAIYYTRGLRDEIEQAKSLSEQWQRRYEDERQASISADQAHREAEAQRGEQLRALEAELKQQEALGAQAAEPTRRLPSEGNLPLFILNSVRSGEPNPARPVNSIDLPRTAPIFAFSIALEDETRYETYRITILDGHRRPVWKSGELRPGRQSALSIWLKTSLFQPGGYTLIVEGDDKDGRKNQIGNYPFLIIK